MPAALLTLDALLKYQRAVERELRRARKNPPPHKSRGARARIVAVLALEGDLREQLEDVGRMIARERGATTGKGRR
jgi:hypothetical protein